MRPHIVKSEQLRLSAWVRRGGRNGPDLGWSCERAFRGGQPPASPGVAQENSVIDQEKAHACTRIDTVGQQRQSPPRCRVRPERKLTGGFSIPDSTLVVSTESLSRQSLS